MTDGALTHATDLVLRNVRIQLSGTDSRPKLVSDDTPRLTAQPPL